MNGSTIRPEEKSDSDSASSSAGSPLSSSPDSSPGRGGVAGKKDLFSGLEKAWEKAKEQHTASLFEGASVNVGYELPMELAALLSKANLLALTESLILDVELYTETFQKPSEAKTKTATAKIGENVQGKLQKVLNEKKPVFFIVGDGNHYVAAAVVPTPDGTDKKIYVVNSIVQAPLGDVPKSAAETGREFIETLEKTIWPDSQSGDHAKYLAYDHQIGSCCGYSTAWNIGVMAAVWEQLSKTALDADAFYAQFERAIQAPQITGSPDEVKQKFLPLYTDIAQLLETPSAVPSDKARKEAQKRIDKFLSDEVLSKLTAVQPEVRFLPIEEKEASPFDLKVRGAIGAIKAIKVPSPPSWEPFPFPPALKTPSMGIPVVPSPIEALWHERESGLPWKAEKNRLGMGISASGDAIPGAQVSTRLDEFAVRVLDILTTPNRHDADLIGVNSDQSREVISKLLTERQKLDLIALKQAVEASFTTGDTTLGLLRAARRDYMATNSRWAAFKHPLEQVLQIEQLLPSLNGDGAKKNEALKAHSEALKGLKTLCEDYLNKGTSFTDWLTASQAATDGQEWGKKSFFARVIGRFFMGPRMRARAAHLDKLAEMHNAFFPKSFSPSAQREEWEQKIETHYSEKYEQIKVKYGIELDKKEPTESGTELSKQPLPEDTTSHIDQFINKLSKISTSLYFDESPKEIPDAILQEVTNLVGEFILGEGNTADKNAAYFGQLREDIKECLGTTLLYEFKPSLPNGADKGTKQHYTKSLADLKPLVQKKCEQRLQWECKAKIAQAKQELYKRLGNADPNSSDEHGYLIRATQYIGQYVVVVKLEEDSAGMRTMGRSDNCPQWVAEMAMKKLAVTPSDSQPAGAHANTGKTFECESRDAYGNVEPNKTMRICLVFAPEANKEDDKQGADKKTNAALSKTTVHFYRQEDLENGKPKEGAKPLNRLQVPDGVYTEVAKAWQSELQKAAGARYLVGPLQLAPKTPTMQPTPKP